MSSQSGADAPLRRSSSPDSSRSLVIALAWTVTAVPLMVLGAVLFALVPGVTWWQGLVVGALIGVVLIALRLRGALTRLLGVVGAEPADDDRHARFFNLAEGLSLAAGIPRPELYVVDDEGRNAAAVAWGDRSAIVATSGLLANLDRINMEGIVAEALVQIEAGDAESATVGASLFAPLLRGPVAAVTTPVAGYGLRRLFASDRDLAADRAAVALTRYPPGLHGALGLIRAGSPVLAKLSPATDHIWLVDPSGGEQQGEPAVVRAPLDLRIDVLGEF